MLLDAEQRQDDWFSDTIFDVCICGAGPAGITLARKLAAKGWSVGLFESGDLELKLNFSHKFGVADFFYDDDGVRASLSFSGQAFFVDVPWTAVYGMLSHVDGERMIWPDSLPEELKALLPPQARHAIDAGDDEGGDDEPPGPPRPTLRRVK